MVSARVCPAWLGACLRWCALGFRVAAGGTVAAVLGCLRVGVCVRYDGVREGVSGADECACSSCGWRVGVRVFVCRSWAMGWQCCGLKCDRRWDASLLGSRHHMGGFYVLIPFFVLWGCVVRVTSFWCLFLPMLFSPYVYAGYH